MKSVSLLKMQELTVYICLQLPGVCDDMTEKNVDKIKIGDNIINSSGEIVSGSSGEIVSGIVKWFSPEKGLALLHAATAGIFLFIIPRYRLKDLRHCRKGRKYSWKYFPVRGALKHSMSG